MQCTQCHVENAPDSVFCESCGRRLEVACPSCGETARAAARFCRKCGTRLPAGQYASPESYTPRHLAQRIFTSRSALEGERKQVTVLFADLKGSLELMADRDPEEARSLLDPILRRMMDAVHRYEGTVNQVMGDGIMALFGAPVAVEDHAVRACYAALDMQQAIARYADEVRARHGIAPQIRVGINSGEVVVRAIGSDLRMDYTAVGQTTHLAARLEQLAQPGTILITTETLHLAGGQVATRALGRAAIKGLEAPVEVYELTGATRLRSRWQAAVSRGLSPLVGRASELAQLHDVLERASGGQGRLAALVGEPGVGKSRLIREAIGAAPPRDWLVLEASAASWDQGRPYRPLIDVLRAYFQLDERDEHADIRQHVAGHVAAQGSPWALPAILGLLDVPAGDEVWEGMDPAQRRHATLAAVQQLFLEASRRQPVVLVMEDLHWLDGETQAALDILAESLPAARLALIVTYRPEYRHGWSGQPWYVEIRLEALPPEHADELLASLLGHDPSVEALKRVLVERTQGNPFFLEESVRTLVETDVLAGQRGAYRLARSSGAIHVPPTVQAVLAARFDRLAPDDKQLLQQAAVIGKDFSLRLLSAIADRPPDELRQRLEALQGAEFVYQTALFPDAQYTFKHPLTHEVAYEELLQRQRRALHGRVVEALEAADRVAGDVESLAHHAFRAGWWERAVHYARQAGIRAAGTAARDAVTYFRQALTALRHLPPGRATLEQTVDLRLSLGAAFVVLADFQHASECLLEADRTAEALDDRRRSGRLAALITQCSWLTGELDRAVTAGQRALAVADELGDFPLQIRTRLFLGWTWHLKGDYAQARRELARTIALLPDELGRRSYGVQVLPAVGAGACLAWCLSEQGAFAEATAVADEATRLAESVEHPLNPNLVYARFGSAMPALHRGDLVAAQPLLEEALQVCRRTEQSFVFPLIAAHLGRARALLGRLDDAESLLEQAVERSAAGVRCGQPLWTAWLGECRLATGRMAEAEALAARALDLCRRHGERGHEAWILRLGAEIAARREPQKLERALAGYRAALALAGELGMRPLVAHCHLGIGRLEERRGNRAVGASHLEVAARMYGDMGMHGWLARAEREGT